MISQEFLFLIIVVCTTGDNDETVCHGHGVCIANGCCVCKEGWSGELCENEDPGLSNYIEHKQNFISSSYQIIYNNWIR